MRTPDEKKNTNHYHWFLYYWELGWLDETKRSHQAVADHFNVPRPNVSRAASKNDWANRISELDEKTAKKLQENLTDRVAKRKEKVLSTLELMGNLFGIKLAATRRKYEQTMKNKALDSGDPQKIPITPRDFELCERLAQTLLGEVAERTEQRIEVSWKDPEEVESG